MKIVWKKNFLFFSYFVIPEIHRQKHVRRSADVNRGFIVVCVENVNVAVVAGCNEVVLVESHANCTCTAWT